MTERCLLDLFVSSAEDSPSQRNARRFQAEGSDGEAACGAGGEAEGAPGAAGCRRRVGTTHCTAPRQRPEAIALRRCVSPRPSLSRLTSDSDTFLTPMGIGSALGSLWSGVSWHKKTRRWQAAIWHNSKNHSLGYFVTEEAAAEAVQTAAKSGRFSTRCGLLLIIVCRLSGLDLSCVSGVSGCGRQACPRWAGRARRSPSCRGSFTVSTATVQALRCAGSSFLPCAHRSAMVVARRRRA